MHYEYDPGWLVNLVGEQQAIKLNKALSNPDILILLNEKVNSCSCIAGSIYCTCTLSQKPLDYSGFTPERSRSVAPRTAPKQP